MSNITSEPLRSVSSGIAGLDDREDWQPGRGLRVLARLHGGVRSVADSVVPREAEWHRIAAESIAGGAPLWAVLGDSTAQGVGATSLHTTWVSRISARLDADGRRHAVVNLSRSGAVVTDVLEEQLPMLASLPRRPTLVTCCIGVNDLTRSVLPTIVARRVRQLAPELPRGSVLATIPAPRFSPSGRLVNGAIRRAAAEAQLRVAELGPHLLGPRRGTGRDGFHPSDAGYGAWVAAFSEALGLAAPPDVGPESSAPVEPETDPVP